MRALVITEPGGPEVLQIVERPTPTPGAEELLVRVRASGLNRADLLQRRGLYPAPPGVSQDIPGLELAGEVEAVGEGVTGFSVGDRVMGIVAGGACAELCLLHQGSAMAVPSGMAWPDAGAIPEAFLTAYDAAVLQGGLAEGGVLAMNAIASGVGTAAIQIARAKGASVVGSSRSAHKLRQIEGLGLTEAVEGGSPELAAAVRASHGGCSVVVDLVGGEGVEQLLGALRGQGTLVLVGLLAGRSATLNLGRVLTRRLRLQGTVLRGRSLEEKARVTSAFRDTMLHRFDGEEPELRPLVHQTLSWNDAAQGHQLLEDNATVGKVVLVHDV